MVTSVKKSTLSTKLLTPIFNSFSVELFALVSLADIEVKQWQRFRFLFIQTSVTSTLPTEHFLSTLLASYKPDIDKLSS